MNIIKKIKSTSDGAKSAAAYTISTLFSRGLAIITVPIFTRIMTTDEIGTVNIYNSWYSLLSVIATLSLTSGGFSVAMKEYPDKRNEYISSILSLTSIISLLFAIVFLPNLKWWGKILEMSPILICLMLLGFLFAPARDFWLAKQRYEYKYKLSSFVIIGSAVLASVLSIVIVLSMRNADNHRIKVAEWRLIANYLVIYGVAAIIWIYLFAKGKTFYNREFWVNSLKLSLPLVGHALASQVLSVSDRIMIGSMVDKSAVGIYSTLYTVSSISLMIWSALNSSFIPFLYQNIDYEDKRNDIVKVSNSLIGAYGAIAVVCTFFAPEIVKILATEEYYEAIYIMPPIAAGVFLTAISNIYSNVLLYNKKTVFIMISTLIAGVSNIILNYFLIPVFGYMAAAYTTLISYILMALMEIFLSNYYYKKKTKNDRYIYNNKALIGISILTIFICITAMIFYKFILLRYLVALILIGAVLILLKLKVITIR